MTVLAQRLRTRARELGLTDAEVARRAGVTERGYGHYVTGARRPSYETLLRLCAVLETSPNHLLGFEGRTDGDPVFGRAAAALNMLDEDGRRMALDLLDTMVRHRRVTGARRPSPDR